MALLAPLFLTVFSIVFFWLPSLVSILEGRGSDASVGFCFGCLFALPLVTGFLNIINSDVAVTNRRILCKTGILSEALDRASFGKDRGHPSRERATGPVS
jgi:hypothetical protein